MLRYSLITEQSRKSRSARNIYENLRQRVRPADLLPSIEWESVQAVDGVRIAREEMHRVLNLRLQDEHLSPYIKTDLNLFQMLMLDESAQVSVYKAPQGWLFVYDGLSEGPKPFGQLGFDTR